MNFLPLTKEEEKHCCEKISFLSKQAQRTSNEELWKHQLENGNQMLIKVMQMTSRMYNYLLQMESSLESSQKRKKENINSNFNSEAIPFFLFYRPNETNYILLMIMFGFCRCTYRICKLQLEYITNKYIARQYTNEVTAIIKKLAIASIPELSSLDSTSSVLSATASAALPFTSTIFDELHDPTSGPPWDLRHSESLLCSYRSNLRECFLLLEPSIQLFLTFYPHLQEYHRMFLNLFSNYDSLNEIMLPIHKQEKTLSFENILTISKDLKFV